MQERNSQKRWTREEVASKLIDFEQAAKHFASQRQLAEELEIPRSTLQHWLKRKDSIEAAPEVVAFFESPMGVAFLHRLVLAAHFVMTLLGPCGIRLVCMFLELSGLDRFVAASYSSHQEVSAAMEEAVVEFGKEEKRRLAAAMEPKKVTVCQDETFHPETCLVAIEPASNFILLEKYAANRKAKEWTAAMKEAIESLPVEVVQSTSDEGRGILHHVEEELGAHHSPDLFHVQQELVKGTSVVLEARNHQAQKTLDEATREVSRHQEEKEAYLNDSHRPGRPPKFDQRIQKAQENKAKADETLQTAHTHQEQAKKAIQDIGDVYHPYDTETGVIRSAEEVSSSLEKCFSEIEQVASEASLPERCIKKIKKAKRIVVSMVATIAFFFLTIRAKVEALGLPLEVEEAVFHNLIPGIYLHLVSEKVKSAEKKHKLKRLSEDLLAPLKTRDGPFCKLNQAEIRQIEQLAEECAQLFQRSSSCVEGRNGQLSLRHHSMHRISDRKLAALTTAHNYFVKRSDGTTAAERFFGARPKNLFEWVLGRVDLPGRPAQKRSQPKRKEYLSATVI